MQQETDTFISESIKPKLLFGIPKWNYIIPEQSKQELVRKRMFK